MKTSIRPAVPEDLEAVAAIEAAWPTSAGWSLDQFESELRNPRSRFLVAEEDGKLAAYAVYWSVPPEAQILDIAVAPGQERKGLGRFVLDVVLSQARRLGLKKAVLEVRADNAPAQALYQAAGFRIVGRRPKFYNSAVDAILMDRSLE